MDVDAIVYRLKESNIDDTRFAIKVIEAAEFNEPKTMILLSTSMSWAMTRKSFTEADQDDEAEKPLRKPYEAFTEDAFVTRKPHNSFKGFVEIEKRVMRAKSKYLRTFVFFCGILYGEEEEKLHQWFKLAWNGEGDSLPVFLDGGNYVPMIHVQDLVSITQKTIEEPPQPKDGEDDYQQAFLAVDESQLTQSQIVECISQKFGFNGKVEKLDEEECLIYDYFEYFTADVKLAIGAVNEFSFEWVSKEGFAENFDKIKQEFEKKRNLAPLRILMIGPPGAGKSHYSAQMKRKYRLDVVNSSSVISDFEALVKEKEATYHNLVQEKKDKIEHAKQLRLQKKKELEEKKKKQEEAKNDGDDDEDNQEPPQEEDPEEPAEEDKEEEEGSPIFVAKQEFEKYKAILDLKENSGRYNDTAITEMFRWKLSQPRLLNHGWILDGFPKTVEQAKLLFIKRAEGDDEPKGVDDHLFPDYCIIFNCKEKVLEDRLINITDPTPGHNDQDGFKRRLEAFNKANDINNLTTYLLGYIEECVTEQKRQCITKEVVFETERDEKEILTEVKEFLGKPHNYGPTEKELKEKERRRAAREDEQQKQEQQKHQNALERKRKQAEERERVLRSDAERLEEIRKQEKIMLEVKSQPLRVYLMENVIPVLTKGLIEVCQMQPEDPVDYLAEWLFKQIPDDK
ncbi:adenylate kinase [Naegleria gruberi]|uniref:Adenylate kinase n=1 Tax=Naegleria gruberi TaxID=5762 RepID=D2VUX9_NAEGR|nr:adenylate kinase [Naegleria gruberi]EFC39344.1 adenylate kinase [Naegleria gruberi]|eukprot:XP_002672088.1 adenylate kinase [Naegleria gruberi strain NEG-M]